MEIKELSSEERREEIGKIHISHGLVRENGPCDCCADADDVNIQSSVAILQFKNDSEGKVMYEAGLCEFHEGVLLMKLLTSYRRRMQTNPKKLHKKQGFKGAIPKEQEDGSVRSAMEKIAAAKRGEDASS